MIPRWMVWGLDFVLYFARFEGFLVVGFLCRFKASGCYEGALSTHTGSMHRGGQF